MFPVPIFFYLLTASLDDACRFIGRIKSLVDLILPRTGIGHVNIGYFANLTNIQYFDVAKTNVTIENMKNQLSQMQGLKYLNLGGAGVGVASTEIIDLETVHEVWPQIQHVVHHDTEYFWNVCYLPVPPFFLLLSAHLVYAPPR